MSLGDLLRMTSGECRCDLDVPDIHVFCWAPCDPVVRPDGKTAWVRREQRYKVVTDGDPSPWASHDGWMTLDEVAAALARRAAA